MDARRTAILSSAAREVRAVDFPLQPDGKRLYPSELFGQNVFGLKQLQKALPKSTYASFMRQLRGKQILDKPTADAVAHAVRIWAMDRGATHFTHWFQPQTDSTAEKHDSFIDLKSSYTSAGEEVNAIDGFSGSQLLQSEPDASSFPSGGMRTTFEARGYTIWDTRSPMFIKATLNNTMVLYIPSVFISYNGAALDEKTVLLRSSEALSKASCELLDLLDPAPAHEPPFVSRVNTTLGTEQEFFLIDRGMYSLRPDLKICGRALLGNLPPKHQQLEDHYFGHMPQHVLSFMSEMELELLKLGVPLKTRHNEVAPAQFEVAPIFEEVMVAVDHNLLTMNTIQRVADRHGLRALLHEKPFKGINGSGKHCNWSLATDRGENLLNPSSKPETNYRFLLFLVAVLNAVHEHGGLLRAGIASASNDHRLGANEAPPGIISAFLGEQLTEVLNAIEEGRNIRSFSMPEIQTIKLHGTRLDVKVASLPNIDRDLTDRNRTSPFAFTGNKFEFRAVGSKQSPSFPMTLLNSAVADSIQKVCADLVEQKGDKPFLSDADKLTVIRKYIKLSKPIRFEGDNYSQAWADEAKCRGLPNIKDAPTAFEMLKKDVHIEMLTRHVFTKDELESRYHILMEKYLKDVLIEANTVLSMLKQQVVPAALEHRASLASSLASLVAAEIDATPEKAALEEVGGHLIALQKKIIELELKLKSGVEDAEQARELLTLMEAMREDADQLENVVNDRLWPFPKFTEILL